MAIKLVRITVSVVSQFMHTLSKEHMGAIYQILRYLKSALGNGLLFTKISNSNIEGYIEFDWVGDQTTRSSMFGSFTFVKGNLVTWKSRKQKVVTRSSFEAKFWSMAHGVYELVWVWNILRDLGIQYGKPMTYEPLMW